MTPKIPQPPKKQYKTVKIPYFKNENFIFFKKIDYNIKNRYKKISYIYEKYDENGMFIQEFFHRKQKPAVIIYRQNFISELQYWKNGKKHREWGPAVILLNRKHEVISEKWFIDDKKLKDADVDDKKLIISRRKKMYKVILKMFSNN